MALEKQVIPISLGGSLDTKTDEKQVLPGDFVLLENAVFNVDKKLKKRNGYDALGKTVTANPGLVLSNSILPSTMASGVYEASFGSEIVMSDGMGFYSYLEDSNTFGYKGRNECLGLTAQSTFKDQYNAKFPTSAINAASGLKLSAWQSHSTDLGTSTDYLGIKFALSDIDTKQVFFSFTINSGGTTETRPKCVALGSKLFLIYFTTTDNTLKAVEISKTGISSATTLVNNIDTTNPNYEVNVDNSILYVAYNGTSTTVKAASFNTALASLNTFSQGSQSAPNGIAVWSDPSHNQWIAWNDGIATKALVLSSTLASVLATTTVDAGGGMDTADPKENVTGVYDTVNSRSCIFYDQHSVPILLNPTGESTVAGFTMPAVGSDVQIDVTDFDVIAQYIGQVIYIADAGYFYVSTFLPGPVFQVTNLGYFGNAAPAASIGASKAITPTGGLINAVTYFNTLTVAGTTGTTGVFARSVGLASKAFFTNGAPHVVTCFGSNIQPTYYIGSIFNNQANQDVTPGHFPLKIFSAECGGLPGISLLSQVNLESSGSYQVELLKRFDQITVRSGPNSLVSFFNGVFSCSINPDPTQIKPLVLANNLHMPSGTLWMYDGLSVVEHNFNYFPESVTGVVSSSGGFLSAGQYAYKVVYSWVDIQGNLHRSSPSAEVTFTATSDDLITLTIPTMRLTEKKNVIIEVYRTAVNGTVYYNIGAQRPNSTLSATVTYVDAQPDENITNNQQLYTTGEVQNNQAPSLSAIASYYNRIVGIPFDSPNTYWFSKQVIAGFPVEFSASFVKNISEIGGDTISVAVMDDKLILPKKDLIYYVVGVGPAPSGQNDDLTDPIPIAVDVGISDKASIVTMPLGLMFKTSKGIYLLDRSLAAKYVGADVESYNALTINSSQLVKKNNQIVFMTDGGLAIVYDYYYDKWSVFTNFDGVSSIVTGDLYSFLKDDGTVYVETPGVYSDDGEYISMKFRTSWLQLSGIQGFQRVWKMLIVGNYYSAHDLIVEVAYDFNGTATQTETITGTTVDSVYQWRVNLDRQRCEAIQLTIYDDGVTPGQGMDLSALTFEAGIKKGANKLGATQSYG